MKKLLICVSLLASTASLASAAGINLGWLDCPSGVTYQLTRTFACNTNTGGGHSLVATFVAPAGLNVVTGYFGIVDLQTGGASLSPWWQLKTGGCRTASGATHSADFTGGPGTCFDYWQGGAVGGYGYQYPTTGANRARIQAQAALPSGDSRITSIPEGTEVYTWKLTVNNQKTTGLGACGGCTDEVCIVYNQVLVTQTPGSGFPNAVITNPAVSAHVIWQNWTNPDITQACPAITPTRNRTWGSIKSLYR